MVHLYLCLFNVYVSSCTFLNFNPIFFKRIKRRGLQRWSFDVASPLQSLPLHTSSLIYPRCSFSDSRSTLSSLQSARCTVSCWPHFIMSQLFRRPPPYLRHPFILRILRVLNPLLRCSLRPATIAQVFCKIYVCRRARNGYGWPVIYFSSNCNFSNTYRPPDKCARLFLTRLKNTTPASTAFLQISSPPPIKERS